MHLSDDYADLSRQAAAAFAEVARAKPDATVILATGNTPIGMYDELTRLVHAGTVDLSRLRVFQLDEYVGIAPDDRRALYGWMDRAALAPWGVPAEQVVRLPSRSDDFPAAIAAYEAAIAAAGGIDLCILGLGPNGHIGFNEPPADRDAPTRLIDLTPESIASNAPYWGGIDQVPTKAITAGMRVLLASRRIFLLVSGGAKRAILHEALHGPVTSQVPASYLQSAAGVEVFADRAAAGA